MKHANSILLVCVIGVMLMLGGCRQGDSAAVDRANSTGNGQAASTNAEKVELRISGFKSGSEIGAIPELNEKFMLEHPNIKVSYVGMPGLQFNEFIKTRFAVNDASDIIMLHPGHEEIGKYSKVGYILDLSQEPWVSTFTDSALTAVSFDNKVYGTPNEMVVLGVYYNKSMFAKLGLDIPRNWPDFLDVCARIRAAGITPISIGNNDGWMTLAALYAMWPSINQDPYYNDKMNARTIKFNGTWNEMVKQWYSLEDKGYLTRNSTSVSLAKAQQDFAMGKAAMYIDGSWSMAGIIKSNPDLQLGMFPMPANNQGEQTYVSASVGTTWTINKKTAHLAEAKLYLDFWSRPDNLKIWTKSQDSFITLKGVDNDVAPELSAIAETVSQGKNFPSLDWEQSGAVQTEMMNSIQGVYLKAITVEQMLQNMDDAWDRAAGEAN